MKQIIDIQNKLSFPDKKMAELCEIQPFTYSKCKSDKALKNKFNQGHLYKLRKNLKKLFRHIETDWNYLNDSTVEFYFFDGSTLNVDRSEFIDHCREVGMFQRPVSEDDTEKYIPSYKEYEEAEKEFWDGYFNIK